MLPISLRIQGFYSYENEVEIDFTRLMRGGIFGIFGKVGSGKSSILEAMMFALYGEVARMDSKGRSYNIMNLRSSKMSVDFIFKTSNATYRIIVTATRNKRNFDIVNSPEFRHFILQEDNIWKPIDDFDAAKILGLEAKNFRQTVIIPQNEFQNFLHLGSTDRTRMIKDIFSHLEKFELEENVKTLETENSNALLVLKEKLNEIGEVSETLIKEKKQLLKKIKADITESKKEIDTIRKREIDVRRLKEKTEAIATVEKELKELAFKENETEILRQQITDYEYYLTELKTLHEQVLIKTMELATQQKDISAQNIHLQTLEKEIHKIAETQANRKTDYKRRDEILKEVEDYKLLAKIKKAEQELVVLKNQQEKNNAGAKELEAQKQILLSQKLPLVLEHEALSANPPDFSELNAIADWFNQSQILQKDFETLSHQKTELETKFNGVNVRKIHIIGDDFVRLGISVPIDTKLSECVALIKNERKNTEDVAQTLQKEIITLHGNEKLEALSAELIDGNPCPLCGAVHHPNKMNVGVLRQHLQEAEKLLQKNKKKSETINNVERELFSMLQSANDLNLQIKNNSAAQKELEIKIRSHLNKFTFENFFEKSFSKNILEKNSEKSFSKNISEKKFSKKNFQEFIFIRDAANLFNEKLSTLKKEIDAIDKKIETVNLQEETIKKNITENEKNVAVIESAISYQLSAISSRQLVISDVSGEELNLKADNLEKHIRLVIEKYIESEKKLQTLTSETDKLQGIISEKNNALRQTQNLLTQIKTELDEKIIKSPFGDEPTFNVFLSKPFDIAKARKITGDFDKNKLSLQNRLTEWLIEIKGEKFDPEIYTQILAQIETLTIQRDILTGQLAVVEVEINDFTQKLERKNLFEKDLLNREHRAANLTTMKSLFARSGFVNYASTVYLQTLCLAANKRFVPLTRHHLRLEVTEDNNFIIRDMMNNGQVRSVKTLSGGQTFQAALSLALALAENIQAITNTHHNFFFLDEGFGSLDKESLQIVFETLKQLQKENRIVGIISHVEEMQQEIENYLLVTLNEETGSRIELVC